MIGRLNNRPFNMIVKMNVSICGDVNYGFGEIVDLPDELAKVWLEIGHALPFEEVAIMPIPETADIKTRKRR